MDGFLTFVAIISGIGAIIIGFRLAWLHLIKPIYHALLALSVFIEAQPTLLEIAHEFKKNDGNTLRDQVDNVNIRLGNIEQQMEALVGEFGRWDGEERRLAD